MNNTTKALCLKGAKRYLSEKLDLNEKFFSFNFFGFLGSLKK